MRASITPIQPPTPTPLEALQAPRSRNGSPPIVALVRYALMKEEEEEEEEDAMKAFFFFSTLDPDHSWMHPGRVERWGGARAKRISWRQFMHTYWLLSLLLSPSPLPVRSTVCDIDCVKTRHMSWKKERERELEREREWKQGGGKREREWRLGDVNSTRSTG